MTDKSILFILPGFSSRPVGGHKVVYQYANYLAGKGYKVAIAYPHIIPPYSSNLLLNLKVRTYFLLHRSQIMHSSGRVWFPLDQQIKEVHAYTLDFAKLPKADVYICTNPATAKCLADFPMEDARKFYFIQDFENWGGVTTEDVLDTYRLPLNKIVISKWLRNIIEGIGEHCTVVPNGFDTREYHLTIPVRLKDKYKVSMLYHLYDRKDCATSIKALKIVKQKHLELQVNMFGFPDRPESLPEWFHYYQKPSVETHLQLNNEAAIYVAASKVEGWGLTVGEAMMCGQAVACTDIDGYREMAVEGRNALLSPVGDAEALADNVCRLIENDDERIRIAENGLQDIKPFSLEQSCMKFEKAIMGE